MVMGNSTTICIPDCVVPVVNTTPTVSPAATLSALQSSENVVVPELHVPDGVPDVLPFFAIVTVMLALGAAAAAARKVPSTPDAHTTWTLAPGIAVVDRASALCQRPLGQPAERGSAAPSRLSTDGTWEPDQVFLLWVQDSCSNLHVVDPVAR